MKIPRINACESALYLGKCYDNVNADCDEMTEWSPSLQCFFWLHGAACGILGPGPGIEPAPPAVEVWSLNHWTARDVPVYRF